MTKKKAAAKKARDKSKEIKVEAYVTWKDEQGNEQSYRIDDTPESEWPAHVAAGMEHLRGIYAEHTAKAFINWLSRAGVSGAMFREFSEEQQTAVFNLWEEYLWKPYKPTPDQLEEFRQKMAALFNVEAANEPLPAES
jgi:hypothetical protein